MANKNGILYTFNRNNLSAGPIWQKQIAIGGDCPTCGDGTIASGIFANGTLYYAGGGNVQGGHGSGGSISAFDPGTGKVVWSRQTEQPVLGSPAEVNGMIGLAEGNTFEVINACTGTLLYSHVLPATVYGAVSVARSQFYVGAVDGELTVRPARIDHDAADRPELPGHVHLPGHPQPRGWARRAAAAACSP